MNTRNLERTAYTVECFLNSLRFPDGPPRTVIEEWLVRSRGNPNYLDSCEVIRRPCYYNILFELRTDDPGLLKQVEQSRRDLHVQSYAVDQQKRVLEKKYGLVLFFGFMGWR